MLDLVNNYIKVAGALEIANALAKNTTLVSINLGYNSIKDDGAIAIAKALETNTTLASIDLRSNGIKENGPGERALQEAIYVTNKVRERCGIRPLEVIGVRSIQFDDKTQAELQERALQIIPPAPAAASASAAINEGVNHQSGRDAAAASANAKPEAPSSAVMKGKERVAGKVPAAEEATTAGDAPGDVSAASARKLAEYDRSLQQE